MHQVTREFSNGENGDTRFTARLSNRSSHTRFSAIRNWLEAFVPAPGWPSWFFEFGLFVFKQGWACLFGALMLALLLATHFLYPA